MTDTKSTTITTEALKAEEKPAVEVVQPPVSTKDKWECYICIAMAFPIVKVENQVDEEGKRYSLFYFPADAQKTLEDWRYERPIPLPDAHALYRAENIFKRFTNAPRGSTKPQ